MLGYNVAPGQGYYIRQKFQTELQDTCTSTVDGISVRSLSSWTRPVCFGTCDWAWYQATGKGDAACPACRLSLGDWACHCAFTLALGFGGFGLTDQATALKARKTRENMGVTRNVTSHQDNPAFYRWEENAILGWTFRARSSRYMSTCALSHVQLASNLIGTKISTSAGTDYHMVGFAGRANKVQGYHTDYFSMAVCIAMPFSANSNMRFYFEARKSERKFASYVHNTSPGYERPMTQKKIKRPE